MAPTSFELFPQLPGELRDEIWNVALPQPRFVSIERKITEDYDESKYDNIIHIAKKKVNEIVNAESGTIGNVVKTCADVLFGLLSRCNYERLHTRLQHSWRIIRYWPNNQTQLEAYGFSSNRAQPSLAYMLLLEHGGGQAIFDGTHQSYLWSRCPIPALLHTCQESRRAMQLCGYELAFADTCSIPQIWFNFTHDVLYITGLTLDTVEDRISVDETFWNHLESPTEDITRVQKIALEYCTPHTVEYSLPPFHNLKEILWVMIHAPFITSYAYPRPSKINGLAVDFWGHHETEEDLWGYVESDPMDFIGHEVLGENHCGSWYEYGESLRNYRKWNQGNVEGFFDRENTEIEESLQMLKYSNPGSTWKIPAMKRVYMVTKRQAEELLGRRSRFKRKMQEVVRLEMEEGPRPLDRLPHETANYWAPFVDENEVISEFLMNEWYS